MPSVFRLDNGLEQASTTAELDTSTNAPSILAINGFFCGFTVLVACARIYVRAIMLKTMGTDDYLITAATICGVGVLICFIGETSHGIGMHLASIKPADLVKMLHWQYFHSLIVTVGISLIKLSVATFLLRLVPGKGYKIFLYCMIAFLVAFTCSSAGVSVNSVQLQHQKDMPAFNTLIWSCVPIRASWDAAGEPNAKCFSNKVFTAIGLFNSSVNIVTDILFASLPIPMVWNLQVNIRTKISLIAILSLGYFACAASIVKTVIQSQVLSNPDSTRNDSYFIWNSIELYIGILAASLPSLRPLFKSILETTRSLRTRGITSSGQMGGTRHKYYIHEDGIGMNSLQSRGKIHDGEVGGEGGKYDVRVTTRGLGGRGLESTSNKSEDEIIKADSESMEDVWPLQGIKKTVDVTVT